MTSLRAPVPRTRQGDFWSTWDLEKNLSHTELLLKLETYDSVEHRLYFSTDKNFIWTAQYIILILT